MNIGAWSRKKPVGTPAHAKTVLAGAGMRTHPQIKVIKRGCSHGRATPHSAQTGAVAWAPGCRSGCSNANASICMHVSRIRCVVG
jgi:hypothetical protein